MPVILRSPATHAAAVVGLEKAIREIADIVWDAWHGAIEDDYDRQVARRGDKSIGEGDPKPLPPGLRSKLDQLQRHLVGRYTDRRIGAAVDSAGEDVRRSNQSNLDRQVESAIGKHFRSKPRIGDALRSYRAEAIRRITSVRDTVIPTITKDVAHAYANGWTSERLAKHWEDNGLPVEYGTVEGRARVIAASELGRLNMHVTREVHRELGIESYRWRHSGKAKFRPVHKARDKAIFSWKKPPPGGHPGNEPGCGCGADAVLDDETIKRLSEADENTAAAESPPAQSGQPPARVALQPAVARLPVPMEALAQAEALAKRKAEEGARRIILAEQEAARVAEARAAALAKKRSEEAARRQAEEQARHQAAKLKAIEEAKREAIEREVARQRAELARQAAERQAVEAAAQRAAEELAAKRAAEAAARETARRVALEESRVRELARARAEAESKAQIEAARIAAEAERKRVVEAAERAETERRRKLAEVEAKRREAVAAREAKSAMPKAKPDAAAVLAKETATNRQYREELLAKTEKTLGPSASTELASLRARQAAATQGRLGVVPRGGLVRDVAESQAQRDAWVGSLSADEKQAVFDWSREQWFRQMKMVDSGRGANEGIGFSEVDANLAMEGERKMTLFREAMAKAPRFEGTVSRGLRDLPKNSPLRKALDAEGSVIELESVTSWSAEEREARGFAADDDGSYLLQVVTKQGALISDRRVVNIADEIEIMIDKGARFRVVSSKKRKGDYKRRLVILEEL